MSVIAMFCPFFRGSISVKWLRAILKNADVWGEILHYVRLPHMLVIALFFELGESANEAYEFVMRKI
jgi:hypothetical protein